MTTATTSTATATVAPPSAHFEQLCSTTGPHTKLDLSLSDCPCLSVCVYSDRAELTRTLTFTTESGLNDIVVTGVPAIDENSIRVTGGTGQVTILEVSSSIVQVESVKKTTSEMNEEKLEELQNQEKLLLSKEATLKHEREWVNNLLLESIKPKKGLTLHSEAAGALLEFHSSNAARLDSALVQIAKEIKELRSQIAKALPVGVASEQPASSKREITITIHSPEKATVNLRLSYITRGASWSPSYDARVTSNSPNFQLIYYGKIINSTGEDWNNTHIVLSTAQPAIGGEPPKLTTSMVSISPHASYSYMNAQVHNAYNALDNVHQQQRFHQAYQQPYQQSYQMQMQLQSYQQREMESNVLADFSASPAPPPPPPAVSVLTTEAHQAICATTFEVPHTTSIASDQKPHKVRLVVCSNAYLRLNVNNTSPYIILPGTVQVFVDSNFVTSSQIKLINPGEKFTIYLGVDSSIVVKPKPKSEKSSVVGLLKRTKTKDITAGYVVKNTKPTKMRVTLYIPIPRAQDDKVKVVLKDPVLENNPLVKLNEYNNLVWPLDLNSNQETTITYSYSFEYPNGTELGFS
ncbi:mucoidy inhibitor MuiA family protein [Pelomyxa schiedti]|nr:mucoidy inhibitor MuiA family protein [Pelomyxa schiedti]